MRALNIDDVIGLNGMTLLAASIVAQPVEGTRQKPSSEIFRPHSADKAAPQADNSPPTYSDLPLGKFWLDLHRYVTVVRKP